MIDEFKKALQTVILEAKFQPSRGNGFPFRKYSIRLEKLLDNNNIAHDTHTAQTGTRYITIFADDELGLEENLKIRFANHADAYGNSDYTCDNIEGTWDGLLMFLVHNIKGFNPKKRAPYKRSTKIIPVPYRARRVTNNVESERYFEAASSLEELELALRERICTILGDPEYYENRYGIKIDFPIIFNVYNVLGEIEFVTKIIWDNIEDLSCDALIK